MAIQLTKGVNLLTVIQLTKVSKRYNPGVGYNQAWAVVDAVVVGAQRGLRKDRAHSKDRTQHVGENLSFEMICLSFDKEKAMGQY